MTHGKKTSEETTLSINLNGESISDKKRLTKIIEFE